MTRIEFTRNYNDLSTNQGFQFEFNCDRCGNGYRSRFQPNPLGYASTAMDAANSLLGGIFGRAADMAEKARSAAWEKAHDTAFVTAMDELKPDFVQCPRCMSWVCRKSCWNSTPGLCKNCAPDLSTEMAAAQAEKNRQKVWESADSTSVTDEVVGNSKNWKEGVKAGCPSCGASVAHGAKFCPECGTKLAQKSFCTECGAEIKPASKFCSECGAKAGG